MAQGKAVDGSSNNGRVNTWKHETRVRSLGQEDPLDKEMATHSSILAWRIPRTEEPHQLLSIGHKGLEPNEATQHAGNIWKRVIPHFYSINIYGTQVTCQDLGLQKMPRLPQGSETTKDRDNAKEAVLRGVQGAERKNRFCREAREGFTKEVTLE